MKAPASLWTITSGIFLQVRPRVHECLRGWRAFAEAIPDPELRRQALLSMDTKTFHCEGGSILGLLAGPRWAEVIRFIVAYQTISDYLDNLCDRSTSLDPEDFAALHASMRHALTPGASCDAYYRLREAQNDGGYLAALVQTCQEILRDVPHYGIVAPHIHALADVYGELQVHKHVRPEDRVARLEAWFSRHRPELPVMAWYEFAACAGSTLGIFSLVAQATRPEFSGGLARATRDAYFPWVQGLHILLDYLIDQEEDRAGGDLNFCAYYPSMDILRERLVFFFHQADRGVSRLPDASFHRMIQRGLLGMYLSDRKVAGQAEVRRIARALLRAGGFVAVIFYLQCWAYRRRTPSRTRENRSRSCTGACERRRWN